MERPRESDLEALADPLLREVRLEHRVLCFPHGAPTWISSNEPAVLDAVSASFGSFKQRFDAEPQRIEVVSSEKLQGPAAPLTPPVYRTRTHLLTATGDAEHFAVADFASGYGYLGVTPRFFENPEAVSAFRYFYLEAIAYGLATERFLAPMHCACVGWKGRGILLCGDSEAGKSTLSYACARAGFTYVSDDGTFLDRRSPSRIATGNCHSIRFRTSATTLFPELETMLPARRANGKMSIEVDTARLPLAHRASEIRADFLVFLRRDSNHAPFLTPYSKTAAYQQLRSGTRFGRESSQEEQRTCIWNLLQSAAGVFEFRYSDLFDAVKALRQMADEG